MPRLESVPELLPVAIIPAAAIVSGLLVSTLVRLVARIVARRGDSGMAAELVSDAKGPLRLLFPALFLAAAFPFITLPQRWLEPAGLFIRLLLVSGIVWTVYRLLVVAERAVLRRFNVDVEDNLKARKVHTQIRVIRRILVALLTVIGLSALLLSFEPVRQIGATLLASAGILGLIVGFAAQKTLGLIVAGLQVALAQPIRIDDVVVLEGEWGRIEEIALTYVVVRIWDLRRLVVPITYFIEQPFQNWTRVSADILGTVTLRVDYRFPVEAMRDELRRILNESPLWDRVVCVLQVTEAGPTSMELRALMSAKNSGSMWDLRCEVREKLIAFVRDQYPGFLPRFRAELQPPGPLDHSS